MKDPQKGQMEDWEEDSPMEMEGEISQMHNVRNQQNRQEDKVVCASKYRKKRR